MPTLDSQLRDIVMGDDISIRRTIDRAQSGFQAGVTITNAWFTVKAELADADPGLVQKDVTTTDVPGTGQIENDGTGDVNMVVRFDLLPADTVAIDTLLRHFDIQVKTNGGQIYTPEAGGIAATREVTNAS